MLLHSYLLAIEPNQSLQITLQGLRRELYRRNGCSSALFFEPVIPLLVSRELISKTSLVRFSKGTQSRVPPLTFSALRRHRDSIYWPLVETHIWKRIRETAEESVYGKENPSSTTPPISPFPGIFACSALETPEEALTSSWTDELPALRSYKIALFELDLPGKTAQWWDGAAWYKEWELSVRW